MNEVLAGGVFMRKSLFAVLGLALMVGMVAAQGHHPVYLYGGYPPTTSTVYNPGVHILDMSGPTPVTKKIVDNGYYAGDATMCRDNKHVLVTVRGTTSTSTIYGPMREGLFRVDPATGSYTTVWNNTPSTLGYMALYDLNINQDGDFIVGVYEYKRTTPTYSGYHIWKITPTGTASTFVSTVTLGRSAYASHRFAKNIQTGKLFWCEGYSTSGYQVSEISKDGTVTRWAAGSSGNYGWYGYYSTPQNYRTGDLEGPYAGYVYQLKKGASSRTTIATLNTTSLPYYVYGAGLPDLQTAAKRRIVHVCYDSSPNGGWLADVDVGTWTVTPTLFTSLRNYNYCFDFYRGRHTQTVTTGKDKWMVRFSAPQYPGKTYAAAVGMSGVAPGIPLADGRTILLNFDAVSYMTLNNLIPSIWQNGVGVLDGNGGAIGMLDLSGVGALGVPIWIAWVVLDPKAPSGIAYVPDPYVMEL